MRSNPHSLIFLHLSNRQLFWLLRFEIQLTAIVAFDYLDLALDQLLQL
jgi:hypothetical protein